MKFKKLHQKMKRNSDGFSVLESLVAISILVSVIVGTTGAVQSGISSYIFTKDEIIAFYLAQEGIEHIRNMRDENGLRDANWLTGIASGAGDPCHFGNYCYIDAVANTISACSGGEGSCPFLRQDANSGLYSYDASDPVTLFKREISIDSIGADEVAITAVVSWSKGSRTREFRVRENILNWQ